MRVITKGPGSLIDNKDISDRYCVVYIDGGGDVSNGCTGER